MNKHIRYKNSLSSSQSKLTSLCINSLRLWISEIWSLTWRLNFCLAIDAQSAPTLNLSTNSASSFLRLFRLSSWFFKFFRTCTTLLPSQSGKWTKYWDYLFNLHTTRGFLWCHNALCNSNKWWHSLGSKTTPMVVWRLKKTHLKNTLENNICLWDNNAAVSWSRSQGQCHESKLL